AARVVEPPVVAHSEREGEDCEPLDADERYEHVCRPHLRDGPPRSHERAVDPSRGRGGRHPGARTGSRYHAAVRSRPSRSGVRASKPNSSCARVASMLLRGCPFGIDVSHVILPQNPTTSATSSASSRIEISFPAPRLTGSGPS